MTDRSIHDVVHIKGHIKVDTRFWNGIDRPEYIDVALMKPWEARRIAQKLLEAADEADKFIAVEKKAALTEKKATLKRLQREVTDLEKEIESAATALNTPGDSVYIVGDKHA